MVVEVGVGVGVSTGAICTAWLTEVILQVVHTQGVPRRIHNRVMHKQMLTRMVHKQGVSRVVLGPVPAQVLSAQAQRGPG